VKYEFLILQSPNRRDLAKLVPEHHNYCVILSEAKNLENTHRLLLHVILNEVKNLAGTHALLSLKCV